jgi:hypothetical protein
MVLPWCYPWCCSFAEVAKRLTVMLNHHRSGTGPYHDHDESPLSAESEDPHYAGYKKRRKQGSATGAEEDGEGNWEDEAHSFDSYGSGRDMWAQALDSSVLGAR